MGRLAAIAALSAHAFAHAQPLFEPAALLNANGATDARGDFAPDGGAWAAPALVNSEGTSDAGQDQ